MTNGTAGSRGTDARRALVRKVAAVAAVSMVLVGCGASAQEKYCAALKDERDRFSELVASQDRYALLRARGWLGDLADQAPDDIADEWQVLLTAIDTMDSAVEDSGHSLDDFADGIPVGVSAQDRRALAAAADQLSSTETVAAANGIEAQARDVCKVNLSL